MARNKKERRIDWGGNEVMVHKLSLGCDKAGNDTPTITAVGVVAAAGTAGAGTSGGLAADFVFTVEVGGTTYYVPMYASNADA